MPLQDVSVDIYLGHIKGDTLKEKLFTDENGHFHIARKTGKGRLFHFRKDGYINFTSTLSASGDTIRLEKE